MMSYEVFIGFTLQGRCFCFMFIRDSCWSLACRRKNKLMDFYDAG